MKVNQINVESNMSVSDLIDNFDASGVLGAGRVARARNILVDMIQDDDMNVSFDVETVSNIPYNIKYVDDSSLENGTEKIKQLGANGIIVNTYKIVTKNNIIVSKELISKDTYNAMDRIILKGTKK